MSKSNAWENEYLQWLFNNQPPPSLTTVQNPTFFQVALHSADPGEAGNQSTSEVVYAGYKRILMPRTAGGFTVAGNVANFTANMDWPLATGGVVTATHFSIGATQRQVVTFGAASEDITANGHGLTADTEVGFTTTNALPPELSPTTRYYVLAAGLTANTFRVATSVGGAAITTSTAGAGAHAFLAADGGASMIYYSGTLTPNIDIKNGVTPRMTPASTITED